MSKDKRETARMIVRLGTTHAHAGQTTPRVAGLYVSRNHPCTRGADIPSATMLKVFSEPPMHTRGRLKKIEPSKDIVGTTHAHAGQTTLIRFRWRRRPNHPCTRGADAC